MWDTKDLLKQVSQHRTLNVVINTPHGKVLLPPESDVNIFLPHRMAAYLFVFVIKGSSQHYIDLEEITVKESSALFVLPHQIHRIHRNWSQVGNWFKLAFDQECMSRLPQSYDFLLNPLNAPVINLTEEDQIRIIPTLQSIAQILNATNTDTAPILLAHLNTLLSELNYCYFRNNNTNSHRNSMLSIYLDFRKLIEQRLKQQPSIRLIARELTISENKLYKVVRYFSGVSPKEYVIQQTILEAQRIFCYQTIAAKEVAYKLGFTDPDYFSRLFKKNTGKTISQFMKEVQHLSGKHLD
jgi:AraC-like DNA-binding protein